MKACNPVQPMLSRYIDGDLPPRDLILVKKHMEQCGKCRTLLEHYATMDALLAASYSDVSLPRDLACTMLDDKKTVRGRTPFSAGWRLAIPATLTIIIALCTILVPWFHQPVGTPPSYILESNGRSIADLPLGSMIYYQHYAGACVRSPSVRFTSNEAEEQERRIAALSNTLSYISPLFDDLTLMSRRSD